MEPGPELNALVAKHVMGWELAPDTVQYGHWATRVGNKWKVERPTTWSPSSDWRAAGEVLEKMRTTGVALGVAPFGCEGKWEAFEKMDHRNEAGQWVSTRGDDCVHVFDGQTGPHAICLAALAAVEEK